MIFSLRQTRIMSIAAVTTNLWFGKAPNRTLGSYMYVDRHHPGLLESEISGRSLSPARRSPRLQSTLTDSTSTMDSTEP
jgi:hypothetical protein